MKRVVRLCLTAVGCAAGLVIAVNPAIGQTRGRATPALSPANTGSASPSTRPAPAPRVNRQPPSARDARPHLLPGARPPNLARRPNVGDAGRDPAGSRRRHLPHGHSRHRFGGLIYYYWLGSFYRRAGIEYESVHPPYGIVVDELPVDAERVEVDGRIYYYFDGVFYASRPGRGYVVVAPPTGALVSHLPGDARPFEGPEGITFVAAGAMYVEVEREGTTWYLVTGTER